MRTSPVIGITADTDRTDTRSGTASIYRLKRGYADALTALGAVAVILPYPASMRMLSHYCDSLSGLLISGGANDVPPEMYGDKMRAARNLNPERSAFERDIFLLALDRGLAVLGVCGGMQLMNVALGGTLIQDIRQEVAGALEHRQQHPAEQPSHRVKVEKDSAISRLCGRSEFNVNSTHHQALQDLGSGLRAVAQAPDGIIEAIELEDSSFCLGVQWHPERMWRRSRVQRRLLAGFVAACTKKP